ncbi:MAG: gas vesicle protein GvpD P-loop domain-containing protein [Cuniculiplasma sp.]
MIDQFERFQEFFNQKFGKSLIIKGRPGTGKTTFSLELASKLYESQPIHFLSSRFNDEPLKDAFPFIDKISYRINKEAFTYTDEFQYVSTDSLKKLEKLLEEKNLNSEFTGSSGLIFDIKEVIPELNAIYSFVEKNFDLGPVVILDSIEAIAQKYSIDETTLFSILQNDLVEKSGAGLIVVLESTQHDKLEYFSDGVISLSMEIDRNYMIRYMRVEKLRGLSLGSTPFFSYSLLNGRFTLFPIISVSYPTEKLPSMPSKGENPGSVSMGVEAIAKVMPQNKSSVDVGSLVLIHRTEISDRTDIAVNLIKNSLIRQTISEGRGVIDVSSSSYETSKILNDIAEPDVLKHYITAKTTKRTDSSIINLEGHKMTEDFNNEAIEYFTGASKKPNVYIFSTDFLNFTYGESFIGDFLTILNEIRLTGTVFMICDEDFFKKLSHHATFTLHLRDKDGFIFLNSGGNKHFSVQTVIDEYGWPSYDLIESV